MKRMLVGAMALATLASTAAIDTAQAQPYPPNREVRDARQDLREARRDVRQAERRQARHRWRTGQRLDRRYGSYYVVNDWRTRRLPPPRRGYHWVRQGDDYVLAALAGGLIASVIAASR